MNDERMQRATVEPYHASWITKLGWQVFVGTIIAGLIIAAGLVPLYATASETRSRQNADRKASVQGRVELRADIHTSEVKITCAIVKAIDTLTVPLPVNTTDEATLERIRVTNLQRYVTRQIIRASMPANIVRECPPAPS